MRGKSKIKKRQIKGDPIYNSTLVEEFINKVLLDGKKTLARKTVYDAFDIVAKKTSKKPLEVFETAIKIASPQIEVKSKRVGGATYQVPMEVSPERKIDLVFRWLLKSVRSKKGKKISQKIADEILAMQKGEGAVIKKRDDVHKMAEANRAFAHFARF